MEYLGPQRRAGAPPPRNCAGSSRGFDELLQAAQIIVDPTADPAGFEAIRVESIRSTRGYRLCVFERADQIQAMRAASMITGANTLRMVSS